MVDFNSGRDALLASAVYLKQGEIVLRKVATDAGKDFSKLPIETQFMLIRLAFNAGHSVAKKELMLAFKGKDVLIREKQKTAGPRRMATIHTAQAIHLLENIFTTTGK